ncbi:hypothetical protein L6452_08967 [Arctium lappa]|uniref:Uncharacterized protein n=1 Tax=Arctium lappa TaxID=4217 RepID=A0ACB9DJ83_ARCLA|nr:hypothetical protein L6452_08967 [Arctium lappa]
MQRPLILKFPKEWYGQNALRMTGTPLWIEALVSSELEKFVSFVEQDIILESQPQPIQYSIREPVNSVEKEEDEGEQAKSTKSAIATEPLLVTKPDPPTSTHKPELESSSAQRVTMDIVA